MFSFKQDLDNRRKKAIQNIPEVSKVENLLLRFNRLLDSETRKFPIELIKNREVSIILHQEEDLDDFKLSEITVSIHAHVKNLKIVEDVFSKETNFEDLAYLFIYVLQEDNINLNIETFKRHDKENHKIVYRKFLKFEI